MTPSDTAVLGGRPATLEGRGRFLNLLTALVVRDVRGRYRRSFLGPAWAILQPVLMMAVFTMIKGFVDIPSDGVPYVIFSFSALVPWTFFATATQNCGPAILSNGSLIKKIAVPREVFPLAAVLTAAFDMLMSGTVLVGMMIWFGVPVGPSLLYLPLLVAVTALLALSIGMFLAAFGTFRRDFLMVGGFLMQIMMYVSPVIYPVSSVPERWRGLYTWNPTVGIIEGFRSILAKGVSPDPVLTLKAVIGTLVAFAIAWPIFRKMSQYFADVL